MKRTAPKETFSETPGHGRMDSVTNKRKEIEALMQAVGLSEARIRKHMDQLEK